MQLHKALRHLVLSQASAAAGSLRAAGHSAAAADVERTALALEFAAGAEADADGGDERATGKVVTIALSTDEGAPFSRTVPSTDFDLYSRAGGALGEDGRDTRAIANAARAAGIFAEFHAARVGAPLDPAVLAALSGASDRRRELAAPKFPAYEALAVVALMAFAAATSAASARVTLPISMVLCWWIARMVMAPAAVRLAAAALPILWAGESAGSATAALGTALALGAFLHAEAIRDARAAALWCVAGGLSAGAVAALQPPAGSALVIGIALVLIAGRLLFVRFRAAWFAATAVGVIAGAGLVRLTGVAGFIGAHASNAESPVAFGLVAPAAIVIVILAMLTLVAAGGWFTGTHRYPFSMLLAIPLLAVTIGTVISHGSLGSAHGLAVAAALTPVLVYRTLRPLWIPSAVRR